MLGEFDTYLLMDYMPMEPEVYSRLFVRQNAQVWPSQFITILLGGLALWLAWRGHNRALGIVLAACWSWVGVTFYLTLFAELNWSAVYLGWAFILQSVILIIAGLAGWFDRDERQAFPVVEKIASGLILFALVLYPLLIPLTGRDWQGVEIFGTAPDPTALVTLGITLLPRRVPWVLIVIPVLWCIASGLIWWAMSWPPGLIVPSAAILCCVLAIAKTRHP